MVILLLASCGADGKPRAQHDGGAEGAGSVPAPDAGEHADAEAALPTESPGLIRSVPLFDAVRISSLESDEHYQRAEAQFDFGAGPFARVRLIVDLDTTCFPFELWAKEKTPEGQTYPPSCDALYRTFELTLDPPPAEGGAPGLEISRAVTPYGGPMHLEVDITDAANASPGAHRMRTFIGTWPDITGQSTGSRGGWNVSAHIDLETGPPPREVLAALPLFDATLGDTTPQLETTFSLPSATKHVRIELRATGHGAAVDTACRGPAEEYCSRVHTLSFDGQELGPLDITRTDCASLCTLVGELGAQYCMENPNGDPDEVVADRAGYCPGAIVTPHVFTLAASAGEHRLSYAVDRITAGGNIRVTAIVYALGD